VNLQQKKRFSIYNSLLNSKRFAAIVTIATIFFIVASPFTTATAAEQSLTEKILRVSDPLKISSFLHPKMWVRLDFYGRVTFSPLYDKETRIIYLVVESEEIENSEEIKENEPQPEKINEKSKEKKDSEKDKDIAPLTKNQVYRDKKLSKYKKTFSTVNYSLIEIKPVESGGYPGVMVLALGTESNKLYSGINIWILEYYTGTHAVSLTFLCKEDKFEKYKEAVETSFKSLIIF